MHEILQRLDEHVAKWFKRKFRSLTPPQRLALPHIMRGENVLICSPTGSGKCITSDEKVLVKVSDFIDLLSGDELVKIAETRGKIISCFDNGKLYFIPSLKVYSIDNNFKTVEAPAMLYVEDYDGEIIEIEMEGGRKIKVTPDHPLLIENKENWVWIPAKDLKVGDKVAVLRKIDCKPTFKKFDAKNALKILREEFKVFTYKDFEKIKKKLEKNNYKWEKLNLEDLEKVRIFCKLTYSDIAKKAKLGLTTVWKFFKRKGKYGKELILKILKENFPKDIEANRVFVVDGNNKIVSFRYPEKVDEKLVKWVAFVLSEGHICYKNKTYFLQISQKKNLKMLREFLAITKKLFDVEFKETNEKDWCLNSKPFVKFVLAYLNLPANREKRIPSWILNLDDNLASIFLRWFFSLEAEIGENRIRLMQASEDIVDKIAYLLLRFGIFSRLNEETKHATNTKNRTRRKYFTLSIYGKDLEKFYAKIGIEGLQITKKFKHASTHIGKFYLDLKHFSEICKACNYSWHGEFEEKYGNIYEVVRRRGEITLNAANKLQRILNEELERLRMDGGNLALLQHLNKILNSHILFVKIKRIKKVKYKGKLVDFTVPNLANFVGGRGAVVLHNTLAAFLFIISELIKLAKQKKLENKVYCIYVSPLRALSRDIQKNLLEPLSEIYEILERDNIDAEEIRVFVRTGDTPAHEKQKMLKKTPHILITTPETLAIVLNTPKFSNKLTDVKWVVVDEIHELASSKRGVHLSLTLERLQEKCDREFVRIGLSATVAPLEEVAKFLVGYNENGEARKCKIINTYFERGIDLKVICPVRDLIHTPAEDVTNAMYKILADLIRKHRTTLIFTNTRSGTEKVVFHLKNIFQDKIHEYEGIKERIAAHHGSLSRQVRHEVEDKLKKGELKAVISSTSLELGIDIGYIDLVAQIGSPKSVARLIQRIGRSGHKLDKKPKGRIICLDRDDLVECAVMVREACKGRIDRIDIPKNCLDVLAQHILGMSIERKWNVYEAYKLVKRSYCYKDLPFETFKAVLRYLSGKYAMLEGYKVYGKIWYDEQAEEFGRRGKYARVIYSLNIGTIPDEVAVAVFTVDGKFIGMIEEDFLERLSRGDIFVLSGKTYRFLFAKGLKAYVEPAFDLKPTVPSWFSEMLPLSFDLAIEIGKFRKTMFELIDKNVAKEKIVTMLKKEYHVDSNSANSIYEYFVEQYKFLKLFGLSIEDFPSNNVILIERFTDEYGRLNIIFHTLYGRRVNDALSRAFAYVLSKRVAEEVGIAICDNGFALILPRGVKVDENKIKKLFEEVNSDSIAEILRDAIRNTELIKRRFRHCATRALMILRNYKGTKIKVSKQQLNAEILLKVCEEIPDFPVLEETFREILEDDMDIKNAKKVLNWIENKKVKLVILPEFDTPSPFSHNIVLLGLSDIILMEDKRAMLEKLHKQVMQKVAEIM